MPKRKVRIAHLTLTVERNGDGFLARCPMVDGGFAEGDTVPEAIFNCVDVVRMVLEYRKERALPLLCGSDCSKPILFRVRRFPDAYQRGRTACLQSDQETARCRAEGQVR